MYYVVTRSISLYSCYLYILLISTLFDGIASPRLREKPKPNSPSNYVILQFRFWAPLKMILVLSKVFLMSHLLTWCTSSSMEIIFIVHIIIIISYILSLSCKYCNIVLYVDLELAYN